MIITLIEFENQLTIISQKSVIFSQINHSQHKNSNKSHLDSRNVTAVCLRCRWWSPPSIINSPFSARTPSLVVPSPSVEFLSYKCWSVRASSRYFYYLVPDVFSSFHNWSHNAGPKTNGHNLWLFRRYQWPNRDDDRSKFRLVSDIIHRAYLRFHFLFLSYFSFLEEFC